MPGSRAEFRRLGQSRFAPELSGALADLRVAGLSDLDTYNRAVAAGRQFGFGYFFPQLLGYNRRGKSAVLMTEDEDSLCVFRWKLVDGLPRLDLSLAPTPMNGAVLARCLERCNDFNADRSARILKVDEADVEPVLAAGRLRVRERKAQFLFAPVTYDDLGGGRFRSIRRYIAKFEKIDSMEIHPYSARHRGACLELLQDWRRVHRRVHGTLGGVGKTRHLLDLSVTLCAPVLEGEVILIDGKLAAFALGGLLRPGFGVFAEAKSDYAHSGLSVYQRYHFMSTHRDWTLINDGPDVGRDGLAQLKNRLRPVGMHQEFSAKQV